jgi:SAM-dependent methyltransferase
VATGGSISDFWDQRAAEDPFYFVDNRMRYGDADADSFWEGGREGLDKTLDLLQTRIESGDRVVEIGCGLGRITRVLADRAASVQAIDVSSQMIEQARGLNPHLTNTTWIVGDGSSLAPIPDASADVCYSLVVFQHIPDPEITLGYVREMGRVLRRGGWAGFQVSNDPAVHHRRGRSERLRNRLLGMIGRAPQGQSHPAWLGSAVDLDRLQDVADGAGMDVERVWGAGTQWCLVLLRKRAV